MQLIKKNIWSLFIAITIIATVLFISLSISQWIKIKNDYTEQNENFTKLISKSTENYFKQIDIILKVLEEELLENETYKDINKSKKFFKKILKTNDSIIAYALINPNGDYLLTQSNGDASKIPNILTREAVKESFLKTLKTNKMTIGRTYFFKKLKKTAIPIRKTIFDKNNKAVAVISVVVPVKNSNLFDEDILHTYSHIIQLFRDFDMYRQLYIYKTEKEKIDNIYTKPVPIDIYIKAMKDLEKSYNMTSEKIKDSQQVISLKFRSLINNQDYLISSKYIKKNDLWAISHIGYNVIINKFIKTFLIYLSVYIIGLFITWWLVNYIYKSEEEQKKYLKYRASHDSLTELPNRYYFDTVVQIEWIEKKTNFHLLYIDLDNFKYVNDTFGHKVGDSVLRSISRNLQKKINKDDLLIRQSGDEFIILTQNDNIKKYSKMIGDSINEPFHTENKEFNISGSLGVSNFPKDSNDLSELLTYADIACYNAKKKKNTYVLFTQKIKNKHIENITIEEELKTALEKNEMSLVYQPQVNYNNTLYGVEALVRWNNNILGKIGPDRFISIAEKTGLMPVLGNFIIDTALKQIKEIQDKTSTSFQLSINISVKQFMEKNFFDELMKKIDLYNINPNLITLEITESVLIEKVDYLVTLLEKLRDKGFTISLDDFGTGYSSLSLLRKIPINELKIDKSFVDDILNDDSAQHVIKTIISIGKILNYHIVLAEGVESKPQVELLHKYGCDTYQGYQYSKPISLNDLEKFILNKTY